VGRLEWGLQEKRGGDGLARQKKKQWEGKRRFSITPFRHKGGEKKGGDNLHSIYSLSRLLERGGRVPLFPQRREVLPSTERRGSFSSNRQSENEGEYPLKRSRWGEKHQPNTRQLFLLLLEKGKSLLSGEGGEKETASSSFFPPGEGTLRLSLIETGEVFLRKLSLKRNLLPEILHREGNVCPKKKRCYRESRVLRSTGFLRRGKEGLSFFLHGTLTLYEGGRGGNRIPPYLFSSKQGGKGKAAFVLD